MNDGVRPPLLDKGATAPNARETGSLKDLPPPALLGCENARSATDSTSEQAQLQSLVDVRVVRSAELLSQLRALLANPSADTEAAFHIALETLRDTPVREASTQLVECLLAVAQYFFLSNQASTAVLPTAQAEQFARHLGERRLLRKALTFAGVMQMATGNLPGAIEAYSEALQVARVFDDNYLGRSTTTMLAG